LKDIPVVECKKCKYWSDERKFTSLVEHEGWAPCPKCKAKLECPHSGEILKSGYLLCDWCEHRVFDPDARKAWALLNSWNRSHQ